MQQWMDAWNDLRATPEETTKFFKRGQVCAHLKPLP